jgi:hypothetical protein
LCQELCFKSFGKGGCEIYLLDFEFSKLAKLEKLWMELGIAEDLMGFVQY